MYSKLFCAIFLSLFVFSHQGKIADNAPSYLKSLMQCKAKEGATEEDVTRHMGFQDALSHAGKCIASCMEEMLGITKDGELQLDTAISLGKKAFGDDEQTVESITKIHQECGALTDPDRCEQGHQRFMCAKDGAQKYGLVRRRHE